MWDNLHANAQLIANLCEKTFLLVSCADTCKQVLCVRLHGKQKGPRSKSKTVPVPHFSSWNCKRRVGSQVHAKHDKLCVFLSCPLLLAKNPPLESFFEIAQISGTFLKLWRSHLPWQMIESCARIIFADSLLQKGPQSRLYQKLSYHTWYDIHVGFSASRI